MPDTLTGSTVPRRQLGRYLRDLRNAAGLTVKDAARGLEWSEAKMWRIETGQTSLRSLDVEAMCRVYGALPNITAALMGLAKETKARGWWQAYGDAVPEWFDLYVGLEAAASRLFLYEQELVPGLLQTADYARTLIAADHPEEGDEEAERRVRLRMARQALVSRSIDPPALQVALNESVLRWPVGGSAIMAAQLDRLAAASDLPNVSLRVVPFSAGFHPGILSGSFNILRFPLNGNGADSEPPTVYADLYTGALYLDKPQEIERYSDTFTGIWRQALDEPSSKELIRQAAEELRHGEGQRQLA
jgi:transcriptional regulator with XRE-family HTH domain